MTVKELIERLGAYPPETRVVVDGYEYGYSDLFPEAVSLGSIALNGNGAEGWWYGLHDDVGDTPAVILSRTGATDNLKRLTQQDVA